MKHLFAALLRQPATLAVPAAAALALLAGSAALAAPTAAALLAGGSAAIAAPAATTAKPATAKFTWHSLDLINGWESASTPVHPTGTPAWATHNGVVYLRGAISNPSASNATQFAQLPASARPASNLYLQVFTQGEEVLTDPATARNAGT